MHEQLKKVLGDVNLLLKKAVSNGKQTEEWQEILDKVSSLVDHIKTLQLAHPRQRGGGLSMSRSCKSGMTPAPKKRRNECSSLPSPDESEWAETGEAEMVNLSELQEALVDMAEQDSRPSDHNTRIDDDSTDSEGRGGRR
jgi:hypothetical protein